jgi:membrane associated rhomboid family serine protease
MKFNFYAIKLVGICFLVFILQIIFSGFTGLFDLNQMSFFEPWRFLTAIFLHGSLTHLLFNCFALALFGSILEGSVGGKRFLWLFFLTGIFANLIAVNFYDSSLGASGAIYGVLGALVALRPFMIVWAFGMPMPMIIAGVIWAAGSVLGIFYPSNVGDIAHLSGIVFGFFIGLGMRKWYKRYGRR